MKTINFILILLLILAGNLSATRYYVDADNGDDSWSGKRNEDSSISPWKTISHVNGFSFEDYDTISFKCGTRIFDHALIPPSDNLVFNYYGTGARPVLDGQSQRYCVDLGTSQTEQTPRSHLNFIGIKFVNGMPDNIILWNCPYTRIDSCNIDSSKGNDIHNCGIYAGYQCSNLKVRYSTLNYGESNLDEGNLGIYIDGADNCLMEYDTLNGNFSNIRIAFGDDKGMATGIIVRYCVLKNGKYDNVDDDGSTNSTFYYNEFDASNINLYFFEDSDTAFHGYTAQNATYLNNTFINSGTEASIHLNSSTAINNGMVFKNNIFYLNNYGYFFDEQRNGQMGAWTFTNNLYYYYWRPEDPSNSHLWFRHDIYYDSLFKWQELGYDLNSQYAYPQFSDTTNHEYSLLNNSPAVLAGVWVGLNAPYNRDIVGTLIGDPPDIGAYQNSTYFEGELTSNKTLNGNVAITADVIVPPDKTLTISPAAHIYVRNGASLRVNGSLNAHSATFNFYKDEADDYGRIIFNELNTINSVLDSITVNNAFDIEFLNGADITIQNSSINYGFFGISVFNSHPNIINNIIYDPQVCGIYCESASLSLNIYGNTITNIPVEDELSQGIEIGNSLSTLVGHNIIHGFGDGIWVGDESMVYFKGANNEAPFPNNLITGNTTGVEVGQGSFVSAGLVTQWQVSCTNNSIYDNSYKNLICGGNSSIAAQSDYWGANGDHNSWAEDTTEIDFGYDLTTDPWGSQNLAVIKPTDKSNRNTLNKSVGSDSTSTNNLAMGIMLEQQGRINDAIIFYKNLVSNNTYLQIALLQLARIKEEYAKSELTNYFRSLLSNQKCYQVINKLLGNAYIRNNRFDDAISAYDKIIRSDSLGIDGINARFEKLFAYLHVKKDKSTASTLLSGIKGMNSKNKDIQLRIKNAEYFINGSNKAIYKDTKLVNENIPKSYSLSQNFPNPFNPSTTIRYQIPKSGIVTLKVYDILGKEVATLVNENKIEGSYDFTFNPTRFASGVYIYQLRVNDFVASKKMLMLK